MIRVAFDVVLDRARSRHLVWKGWPLRGVGLQMLVRHPSPTALRAVDLAVEKPTIRATQCLLWNSKRAIVAPLGRQNR